MDRICRELEQAQPEKRDSALHAQRGNTPQMGRSVPRRLHSLLEENANASLVIPRF